MAIGGTLLFGSSVQPTDLRAAASARKTAPNFTLDDSQGWTIKLSKFHGKVVLLDFRATWCHGCMTEIPWFMEFQDKYKADGLAVIGISMDEDGWKSVKPFVAERKFNYPVVPEKSGLRKALLG